MLIKLFKGKEKRQPQFQPKKSYKEYTIQNPEEGESIRKKSKASQQICQTDKKSREDIQMTKTNKIRARE